MMSVARVGGERLCHSIGRRRRPQPVHALLQVFIGISNLLTWAATTLPDNLVMERPELPISGEVLAEVGLLRSKSGDVGSVAAGSMAAGSAVTSCAQTAASGAARPTSNATARAPPPATPSARGGNEPGEEQQSGEEEAEGGEAEGAPPIVPE